MVAGIHDLLPSRRRAQARSRETDVQLSVRVPAELRRRIREVAEADGISAAELVEVAVRAELARRTDPSTAFAADVAASLQRRMAAALADGTWESMVDELAAGDPDLQVPSRQSSSTT